MSEPIITLTEDDLPSYGAILSLKIGKMKYLGCDTSRLEKELKELEDDKE